MTAQEATVLTELKDLYGFAPELRNGNKQGKVFYTLKKGHIDSSS